MVPWRVEDPIRTWKFRHDARDDRCRESISIRVHVCVHDLDTAIGDWTDLAEMATASR
jgi:hypothetical protein